MISDLERLPWFPFFVSDWLGSTRVQAMEDFQRGWYFQLICHSWQSHPVGYLIHDEQLWRLAGARSRAYFEQHKAVVLACFQSKKVEGREWLYQPRTIEVLHDQTGKYRRQLARSEKGSEARWGNAGIASPSGSPSESFYRPLRENCAPEGLTSLQYARGLLEQINLPVVNQNLLPAAAAITAVAKERGIPEHEATDWLIVRAKASPDSVNAFWFTDAKYRGNGATMPQPGYSPEYAEKCVGGCGNPRISAHYCGDIGCRERHEAYVREYWAKQKAKNLAGRQGRQDKA